MATACVSARLNFATKHEESLPIQHEEACVLCVLHRVLFSVLVQYLVLHKIDEWPATSAQPAFSWVAGPQHWWP